MNTSLKGLGFALATVIVAFAGHAQALPVTLGDSSWILDDNYWIWSGNNNDVINDGDVLANEVGSLNTLYKYYKLETNGEDWDYADYYDGQIDDGGKDALIEFTGTSTENKINCPECYLIVKNGSKGSQYIFDIGGWDGLEDLELSGFYPQQGAISHVAIWGKEGVSVPEPSALILMGLGLIGLGVARRRVAR